MGAILGSRDSFSAFRQRRVIVKARIVRLAGKGMNGATSHLRYLKREGVTREGRATIVLRPGSDGRWRIQHVHSSSPR